MPKPNLPRGLKKTHEINGHKMSKLKHDRIRAFEAMLPQLDERERLNAPDVAALLGCSGSNVNLWLRILGRRLKNHNGRTFFKHDTTDWSARILPIYKKTVYAAVRLQAILPQIAALNAAGKSQADAAAALGTTVCSLRKWIDITGTKWTNLKVRGPYKTRS